MFDAADAFVTMPGGLGTFDETIEITTWRQLGLHDKPVLICNVLGWAQPYLASINGAIAQGFADASSAKLYEVLPGRQLRPGAAIGVIAPGRRGSGAASDGRLNRRRGCCRGR